jgi:hypothetical protein
MRKAKTIAPRFTVDFLPSAPAALAIWRANCREIGGNCSNCPTREAAVRAVGAYRKRHPSCCYSIRQVKQIWGLQS